MRMSLSQAPHRGVPVINLDALLSAIQERKRLAEEAHIEDPATTWYSVDDLTKGHNEGGAGLMLEDSQFIAANSPATVLRQVERDLRVLARHDPDPDGTCWHGDWAELWPCADILDLAHAYAIPTEDTETRPQDPEKPPKPQNSP